jgi:glucose-6-phosphate isomerase
MEIDLTKLTPDIRHLDYMREVLADQNFAKNSPDIDLYYMYRGMEEKNGLRYDITVIPAKMLGNEFVKTTGHYHILAFKETYTVLGGTAIYLMQKLSEDGNIADVYAVTAKKGESVIIPSYYGHVTINPSETEELKMSNRISDECKSDYSLFKKMKGACYYYTKTGWLKNENYKSVPELRFEEPIKSLPEDLNFLKQS